MKQRNRKNNLHWISYSKLCRMIHEFMYKQGHNIVAVSQLLPFSATFCKFFFFPQFPTTFSIFPKFPKIYETVSLLPCLSLIMDRFLKRPAQQFHRQTTKSRNHLISRVLGGKSAAFCAKELGINLDTNLAVTQLLSITEIFSSDIWYSISLKSGWIIKNCMLLLNSATTHCNF